jgi:D-arabinose 1-dehydrogenase-like Zn-dependent alcohol dehydrogenase
LIATHPEVKSATSGVPAATTRALVYRGPGKPSWELHPRLALRSASDAIVRITTSTICGTDLHILQGDLPGVTEGRILGRGGIGMVKETGAAVSAFHKGDKVLSAASRLAGGAMNDILKAYDTLGNAALRVR